MADMIIAVSDKDESNILSCQLANFILNIPTKVVSQESIFKSKILDKLFVKGKIDVDAVISPEVEVAKAIIRQLNTPGAFDSFYLGEKVAKNNWNVN